MRRSKKSLPSRTHAYSLYIGRMIQIYFCGLDGTFHMRGQGKRKYGSECVSKYQREREGERERMRENERE